MTAFSTPQIIMTKVDGGFSSEIRVLSGSREKELGTQSTYLCTHSFNKQGTRSRRAPKASILGSNMSRGSTLIMQQNPREFSLYTQSSEGPPTFICAWVPVQCGHMGTARPWEQVPPPAQQASSPTISQRGASPTRLSCCRKGNTGTGARPK